MGCRLLAAAADVDTEETDDRNSRRVGDDRWWCSGDTFPPSLSLDVDDGGVGGSVNPVERKIRVRHVYELTKPVRAEFDLHAGT